MTDTEVVKVFGGPGTGKTTTLVGNTEIDDFQGILHQLLEDGDPDDVLLIAYTRSAADEAKNRLAELTGVNKAHLDKRITTIHSLVMGFNNVYPNKICEIRKFQGNNDYKDFCEQQDLEYSGSGSDDEDIMGEDDDEGNVFFKINSWLKSSMLSLREWEQCPASSEWRYGDDFVDYGLEWIQYKNQYGVYEFDDCIQMSVDNNHTLNVEHLFVDEVQDLYPLQQAFLDNQFGAVDRIWLAGDDDQTIYEWSGAEPQYFLDMEPEVNGTRDDLWDDKAGYWDEDGVYILDQSWRMPSEVLDLAKNCIHRLGERQEKEIKPHHDGGSVSFYRWPDARTLADHFNHDDTFILFRTNFHASDFGKDLINLGIPFEDRFKTWREETVRLRDGLAALKNDETVMGGEEAAQIVREVPNSSLSRPSERENTAARLEGKEEVGVDELVGETRLPIPDTEAQFTRWLTEYEERNYYQGLAVNENLRHDNEHLAPEGITLETIHWSKGREADTVVLALDTTSTVIENMPVGEISDAERRLYFVGMTRTENELVVAESTHDQSPSLGVTSLFGHDWEDQYSFEDW